ncbi:MBL fold metallo-hydrolase [Actinomadura craniellae]|uniref:MBL fold metallo-hydrolase n=1 Tax=Actinomadura craniellae TaxID=2231787 RepID=A0A365HA73_9ACTN|nr:MBL fold metallo-hydrolase [Actinomadura craniellae]RAY15995.1 MBL fold metallo-hydrolase [Actinomadura craniellae]
MRLTKLGHSCVRLTKDDRTLVIDPGGLTPEQDALAGADAVLVTHEHFDHFDPDRLRAAVAGDPRLEVWTSRTVGEQLADLGGRVHIVGHGDAVQVAGFDVHVYGEEHELLHPDVPPIPNVGFLVDGAVFHPGDALTVPEVPVPNLCLPVQAPWMSILDLYQYVRAVGPERAFNIHDGLLNEVGAGVFSGAIGRELTARDAEYRRLAPGESVDL